MRDHAGVSRKQLRTSNYGPEARAGLGKAVETARVAAGYRYRTDFCRAHGIKNLRGLELLEQGKTGVGQVLLFEVADALPGWDRETPKAILEGGTVAVASEPAPERVDPGSATWGDLRRELKWWHGRLRDTPEHYERLLYLLDLSAQLESRAASTEGGVQLDAHG